MSAGPGRGDLRPGTDVAPFVPRRARAGSSTVPPYTPTMADPDGAVPDRLRGETDTHRRRLLVLGLLTRRLAGGEDAPRTEVEVDGLRVVVLGVEDLLIDRLRAWVH